MLLSFFSMVTHYDANLFLVCLFVLLAYKSPDCFIKIVNVLVNICMVSSFKNITHTVNALHKAHISFNLFNTSENVNYIHTDTALYAVLSFTH